MYDKQVRKRRATFFGLVGLSVMLLTVYFGESASGPLHAMQRAALTVLAPLQEGANRAMQPVRDGFAWVGDTAGAKGDRNRLQRANDALERQITALRQAADDNTNLRGILRVPADLDLDTLGPVDARVISRSNNLYASKILVDKGSSAGVSVGDPVITAQGLAGRVTTVGRGSAQVTLINDPEFATGVRVFPTGIAADAGASVNRPGELELTLSDPDRLHRGDIVVSGGSTDARRSSDFPQDIPIGRVTEIDPGDSDLDTKVRVDPFVDLANLERVDVLTAAPEATTVAAAG